MTNDAAAEAGSKRKAEEEPAAGEAEAAPPAKEPKTEPEVKDEPAAEAGGAEEAAPAEGAPAEAAADGEQAAPQEPVTIGYKTFANGDAALQYYRTLIAKLRKYQNLNDVRGRVLGLAEDGGGVVFWVPAGCCPGSSHVDLQALRLPMSPPLPAAVRVPHGAPAGEAGPPRRRAQGASFVVGLAGCGVGGHALQACAVWLQMHGFLLFCLSVYTGTR